MENSIRLNTIKVEFGERCARPSNHELIEFAIMLELEPDDIHTLYQDTNDDCIYIKFNEVDKMKEVLAKHKKFNFLYNSGESTEVMLSEAQGSSRYVRVFNVPPEVEDEEVREAFEHYGTVHSVEREKYPDNLAFTVYNGVRGVCIDMKKLMPAIVSIKSFRAKVFHRGLNDKCFLCHSVEHDEHNCPKRSNVRRQLRRLNSEFSMKMVENEYITKRGTMHNNCFALNDPSEGSVRKAVTRTQSFNTHSMKRPMKFMTRNVNQQNSEKSDDSENSNASANLSPTVLPEPIPDAKQRIPAPKKKNETLEKLRELCANRGASGIVGLAVTFRRMDDDGNKNIDFDEFKKGLKETGLTVSDLEARELFDEFDNDKSGSISMTEFLVAIKGDMSEIRKRIVLQAFKKLDTSRDGFITCDDLKHSYCVKNHPKFTSGKETKEEILNKFLANFEDKESVDGKVTQEEFLNYYNRISVSIDNDAYFDLMIRKAYKL